VVEIHQMDQMEQLIDLEATECLDSEGKVIVLQNPCVTDEFRPSISILNTIEGDCKYEDYLLEPSDGVVTLENVHEFGEIESDTLELFEQPVSPENPLSISYLNIPTIKGNFDGLKNVRFTDDQAEIKASDASDANIQHLKRSRKSNVVTYVLEEKYTGWLTCAILHSAPEYLHLPVTNFSSPRRTPFEVVEIENGARRAIYQDVTIKDVNAHAASIYLDNEDRFYLKFSVLSTDRKNDGNTKEGKQWIFFVGPATEDAMGQIPDSLYDKGQANNIQVMAELRDPERPKKNKRENCASIPLPDDGTECPLKKMKKLAVSGYSKIVQKMTQDQLETEIQKWKDLL